MREAIRLLEGEFYAARPLEQYRWLREHEPVFRDEVGRIWGVTLHEDVLAISKNPGLWSSAAGSRPYSMPLPSMIDQDDPQHKRRRNLVNRGFTPRRVQDHEPSIRSICHELVDRVQAQGRCEFVRDIAALLPMIVIGDLLGVEPADRDKLLRWSEEMLGSTDASAPPEAHQRAAHATLEYMSYAAEVIRDRRARPLTGDLMSVLVHAEIDGERLADDELIHESLLLLVGGDETTRHVITGGMEALIRHPDQRAKLVADPRRIPVAVEEMLRWVTPIKNMNRTALQDTELRGQKIRQGEPVLLLYESANRDARAFARPDVFDVERDPNPHVAFGGQGTHFCLGASLARLELRVMFEVLLERLPDLALASAAPLVLRRSNFIVGIESMPVEFTPAS